MHNHANCPYGRTLLVPSPPLTPAGGISTGAEVLKTMDQRTRFGGFANAQFDPCYHLACDTVDNIDQLVLIQMSRCAANAVEQLALAPDIRTLMHRPKNW